MTVDHITITHAQIPLVTPYRISQQTFHHFDPYIVEITDRDGKTGFGEGFIAPGYALWAPDETTQQWLVNPFRFCRLAFARWATVPFTLARPTSEPSIRQALTHGTWDTT